MSYLSIQCLLLQVDPLAHVRIGRRVIHGSDSRPADEAIRPQLCAGSESLHQGLVDLAQHPRVQELVHGIPFAGLRQQLQVVVYVRHGVRGDGPAGRRARRADPGEARVAAPQQAVHGGLEVGERERQDLPEEAGLGRGRPRRPRHPVRAAVPAKEGLVREGRSDDAELQPLTHVGDAALDGAEEDLDALVFVGLVLFGAGFELLPRLVGLAARGVNVDDVLARGAEGFVEDGGYEERAEVLGVLERSVPVL